MPSLQEFNFNGSAVRVQCDEKGEPWFIAKDVADVLAYSDTQAMTRRLDDDEQETCTDNSSGQVRRITIINESGLYSAILGSTKPEAKAFKRWVTHEVLPSIRKTGSYGVVPDLLSSTIRMLHALNMRIEAGENVPPHILKYAWNMALCTRTRAVLPVPEDVEIRQVFSAFAPGERIAKSDVYRAYCDKCSGAPMSARAFWPRAKRSIDLTETRNGTGRFIIINL